MFSTHRGSLNFELKFLLKTVEILRNCFENEFVIKNEWLFYLRSYVVVREILSIPTNMKVFFFLLQLCMLHLHTCKFMQAGCTIGIR